MRNFAEDFQFLSNKTNVAQHPFESLAIVADYLNNGKEHEGRELLFHIMDHDIIPPQYNNILASLIETAGLYPYLNTKDLNSSSDLIAYEAHRPENSPELVLHAGQFDAYIHLINGENVVLSAPTSFGKSLLIDILIMSEKYKNIVVIVPTIALIDETRRRIQSKFGIKYKIITHASQTPSLKNIFILTQERFLEIKDSPQVDLFVIDEFYKLSPENEDDYDDRTISLNVACMKLVRQNAQFLLIGPNIEQVNAGSAEGKFVFIKSDFKTVGTRIERINANGHQNEVTLSICKKCDAQTLIFCSSIKRVYNLGEYLLQEGISIPDSTAVEFANWVAHNYSEAWSLVKFLRNGIAIHHSSLPRSIAQYILHLFNEGKIRFLLCTSTIIEGVNTSARNIIIYDNKIARKKYDYFTFNNIKGRAGRMFKHMIGQIYILNPEPQEELPLVDIPAMSLPEGMPISLALETDDIEVNHLSNAEIERLKYLHSQKLLSLDVIRSNAPFDPYVQIDIATQIHNNPREFSNMLKWDKIPNKDQLKFLVNLIYNNLLQGNKGNGVLSSEQLFYRLIQVQNFMPKGFYNYLDNFITSDNNSKSVDDSIREALSFLRTWAEFQLPRSIIAIDRIQQDVLSNYNLPFGNFTDYANMVKHWFRPPAETILEEYGIPMPMTEKISRIETLPETVDEVLSFILSVDTKRFNWSNVEQSIFDFAFPELKHTK
ncbi:DEAD/DEAH box helicase [Candidatus Saccharibacteria bacterium]|nr:DEAD/DEAH box helicase [Candidatus Saccharibacteria bacterium]